MLHRHTTLSEYTYNYNRIIYVELVCIYINIHTCMFLRMYVCMYVHIHTYTYTYTHACIHMYMHTYIHTYTHAYIHTYIHVYIHAYICTYLHTCTYCSLGKIRHENIFIRRQERRKIDTQNFLTTNK